MSEKPRGGDIFFFLSFHFREKIKIKKKILRKLKKKKCILIYFYF